MFRVKSCNVVSGVNKEKTLRCIYFLKPKVVIFNVIAQRELGLGTKNRTKPFNSSLYLLNTNQVNIEVFA